MGKKLKGKRFRVKRYRIRIDGTLVYVTKEVYKNYYSIERHSKTLAERDARNGLLSYHSLDTDEISGESTIPDIYSESVENRVISQIISEKLYQCLDMLKPEERQLIDAIFFEGLSAREYSRRSGIPQKTIDNRKRAILNKLKTFMKN